MNSILGFFYIITTTILTYLFSIKFNWSKSLSKSNFFVYFTATIFSIFFLNFYLIGIVDILFNKPVVSISVALYLAVTITMATYLFFIRKGELRYNLFPTFNKSQPLRLQAKIVKYITYSTYLALAFLLILGFPRGYEVRAYHLPIGINIFQNGSLRVWDHAYMHTFPANMSIWDGFWLQVLPERLVSIVNLPYLAMCVFFLYQLCRLIGSDRSASWIVACGLTTIPLFSFSALELGADVAGVAFIIAAVYITLARPNVKPDWCFISGLSAGMAYGFKSLHLIAAALLMLLIFFSKDNLSNSNYLDKYKKVIKFAIGFLLTAGVWIWRNYYEFGNPIYPIHFGAIWDALGFKAAPDFVISDRASNGRLEWANTPREWLFYPWVEGHDIGQNFKHSSGLGAFFAATVPIAWFGFIILLISGWITKKDKPSQSSIILFSIGTILIIIWWFLGDRQPRYAMGGIALLLPIAALIITGAEEKIRNAYESMLVLGILFMLLVPLCRLGVSQAALITHSGLPNRSMVFEYPGLIDDLEQESTILNLGDRSWHYALYGKRLLNHVISSPEARRVFLENNLWNLNYVQIRQLGVNYVFTEKNTELKVDCIQLATVDKLERNPFNGVKLENPRVLYRVIDQCPKETE